MNAQSVPRLSRRLIVLAVAAALVAVSCGGDDGSTTTPAETQAPATTAPVDTTAPPATTAPAPTTTEAPPTTTTPTSTTAPPPPATTTTTLAGEPFDLFIDPGDILGVVGVQHDDVLNVRRGPGIGEPILTTLEPLEEDVPATGEERLLSQSIWYEVTVDGITGWASARFLAFIGETTDGTSFVVDRLGEIPVAETMLDLGAIVVDLYRSEDPPSTITVSAAPTVGDLGEVTYDVVGLGDDAVLGTRLHVFGQPTDGGEGFSLKSVEVTSLCARGLTEDGICV